MSEAAAEDKIDAVEKLTKKRLKIKDAIDTAIKKFSSSLPKDEDNKQYAKILDELMVAINKDRDVIAKELEKSGKKPTKKSDPVSKQMSIVDVNNFIDSQKDAIFVVTGGSFNPPHNGHIGMFQKAYDALIKENKIKLGDGKKVYGVMVPASEGWLNKKVTDGKLDNSQKIDIKARVDLSTLSCDSYKWTDSTKFNASNMIVVSDGDDDPATSILQIKEPDGSTKRVRDNAYYLCGSDYYASSGGGPYKFICVLRSEVTHNTGGRRTQIHFNKPPIDGSKTTAFDVKPDDIIIEGGEDSEASSTMLRDILTKISKLDTSSPDVVGLEKAKDILLKLVSISVLRKLLELKYILDPSKGTQQLNYIDIDLNAHRDDDLENEDKPANYLSTGLRNGGSYCYLNSAFQFLFSATPLRTWIKSQPKPGDAENTIESNAIQLLKMMVESSDAGSKRTVDGKKFKNNIEELIASTSKGDNTFEVGGQNDSHEVLVPVLDALQEKKPDSVNSLKFREFVRQTKETTVNISDNREKCVTGILNITDVKIISIQIALNNYLLPSDAEVTEAGGKVTVNSQIQLQFEDSNQYFILCLNRTLADADGKSVMNKKKITVDKQITVSQTYDVTGKSITEKKYNFKLRGAILKSGGAGGGHFKYISFENGPTKDPITYNDRSVYVSKLDELEGEHSIENNSYIFLYEKDS